MSPGPAPDLTPPDATLPQTRVWVEGVALVNGWDADRRLLVDQLRVDLARLGLTLLEQEASAEQQRRRWGTRRISREEAVAVVLDHPGLTFEAWTEQLYRVEPWTPEVRAGAANRANVMLHRLRRLGLVEARRDQDGQVRLRPPKLD